MGKKAYVAPRLIPLGKIEEWVKQDVKTDTCNKDIGISEPSFKGHNIDGLLLKVDLQRLKNTVKEELEK